MGIVAAKYVREFQLFHAVEDTSGSLHKDLKPHS